MKYRNLKTWVWMFLAFMLVALTGCEDKGCACGSEVTAPIAVATVSPRVSTVGDPVTFDASGSSDPDGSIVSYQWEEMTIAVNSTANAKKRKSSTRAVLSSAISFTTTELGVGLHTVTLTVTDDDGATGTTEVNVTVNALPNQLPVADAGVDQTVTEGSSVMLDGSASTDPDGTIISYEWKEGNTMLGTAVSMTKADFSVDIHTVTLTVVDDDGASDSDEVKVTVTSPTNTKPVAHGQTYTLQECNTTPNEITLGAHDDDGDSLTYHLVNTDNVTNGTITIPDTTQNKAFFTMTDAQAEMCSDNLPNTFTFKVNDGTEDSDEGGVVIDPPGVSCEVNSDCSVGQYCDDNNMCRYET